MVGVGPSIVAWGFRIAVFLESDHTGPPVEYLGTAVSEVLGHR